MIANGEIWTVDDARRCREASGCEMLMIGRGAVVDPGLGLAIKTPGHILTWPQLIPHLLDFWHIVRTRLETRAQAGRLKQWLNFLRRRFPEAELAYQAVKTIKDPVLMDAWLGTFKR